MSAQFKREQRLHLIALPTELVVSILYELDVQAILRCKQVCQSLAAVIDASIELQYKVELTAANMDDGPPGPLVAATRLEMLKVHQKAWSELAWTSEKSSQISEAGSWELLGGVFGVVRGREDCIRFMKFPSVCRGIDAKDWTINGMGFIVDDFTIDPSRDLLSVVEVVDTPTGDGCFRIHLRRLSDGQPHPLVPNSAVLSLIPVISGHIHRWSYTIQVFGDHLGFMFQSSDPTSGSELAVWNWVTGTVEKVIWARGSCIQGYSFLTNRLIMIGVIHHTSQSLTLSVISLDDPSEEPQDIFSIEPLCSFSYPSLSPSAAQLLVLIRTTYPSPASAPGLPFTTSENDRLLVITTRGGVFARSFVLLVPLSTILAGVNSLKQGERAVVFPWENWGPRGTRMIALHSAATWFCNVHGMKFVTPTGYGSGIQLYDFNHHLLRRSILSSEAVHNESTCLTQETTCDDGEEMFSQRVTTSLPCRVAPIPVPSDDSDITGVMLTEDGLIVVSEDNGHNTLMLSI